MRVACERGPDNRVGLPIPPEKREQGREVVVAHRRARREFNDLVKTRFGFLSSANLVGGHPSHIVELRTRRILVEGGIGLGQGLNGMAAREEFESALIDRAVARESALRSVAN